MPRSILALVRTGPFFLAWSAVTGVLFYSYYFPYSRYYLPPILFVISVLTFLPLAILDGLYVRSRRIRGKTFFLLFSLSFVITGVSALDTTLFIPAGPCADGVSAGGFPMPWYQTFISYTGTERLPCPLLMNRNLILTTFALFSFLYDAVFYVACGIAVNELYKRARRKKLLGTGPVAP